MCMKVNGILSLFPSVTFVVLTADQFVGHDDGPLEQQKKDSPVCRSNRTFSPILRKIRVLTTKTTKSKKLRITNGNSKHVIDVKMNIQQITMRICGFVVHTGTETVAFDRNFDIQKS